MQTNENQHPLSDAEKIVEENFKGLHALIEDEDNLLFYKELIANCLEGFADSKTEALMKEIEKLKESESLAKRQVVELYKNYQLIEYQLSDAKKENANLKDNLIASQKSQEASILFIKELQSQLYSKDEQVKEMVEALSQPTEHKGLEELKDKWIKFCTDNKINGTIRGWNFFLTHLSPQIKPVVDTEELRKKFDDFWMREDTGKNKIFDWFIEHLQPKKTVLYRNKIK